MQVSFLLSEIETYIEVDTAEDAVGGKFLFMVVVGVKDGTRAGKPFGIVVNQTQAGDAVDGELINPEDVCRRSLLLLFFADGVQIGQGGRERSTEQPVPGEHPVVAIAAHDGIVVVFHRSGKRVHGKVFEFGLVPQMRRHDIA